ncbi:MAG: NFACT family protein [Clostridiales bacterium]|jgi:predicted ribosome quality control (RQC) complex YloA/Tae2 family protein|nr:NFACT family protein [Clostridiales bacterium]
MPTDALTYHHIAAALDGLLGFGRIERIAMPSPEELILYVGKNRQTHALVLSAAPARPGAYLTKRTFESPPAPFSFLMHARKHIGGGVIQKIDTLPYERVIRFDILSKDELRFEKSYALYLELVGRQTNLILTDGGGRITDCVRHIPLGENAARFVLPGALYLPPARQPDKLTPDDRAALAARLTDLPGDALYEKTLSNLAGFAPASVKEAIFTAFGGTVPPTLSAADARGLADALAALYETPAVPALLSDETGTPIEFFCRPYRYSGRTYTIADSMNDAVERVMAAKSAGGGFNRRKQALAAVLNKKLSRNQKKRVLFEERLLTAQNSEDERVLGELITANLYRIGKTDSEILVDDYYTGEKRRIKLDRARTPQQNAQAHYKLYAKRKREAVITRDQLAALAAETDYLESLAVSFRTAESREELDELEREMAGAGLLAAAKRKGSGRSRALPPPYEYLVDGVKISAGKNNLQNDRLLKTSDGGFLWLHAKDVHGAHVVIGAQNPSESVIQAAAAIAAYYSKAYQADKAPVDCTRIKNVKKIPGAQPGRVTYTGQTTYYVKPGLPIPCDK